MSKPTAVLLINITGSGKTTWPRPSPIAAWSNSPSTKRSTGSSGRGGRQMLEARNQREDANAFGVTPAALDDFFARFEPPPGDEQAVAYTGDADAVYVFTRR